MPHRIPGRIRADLNGLPERPRLLSREHGGVHLIHFLGGFGMEG
jgi:hypothetical protein